MEKNEKKKKTGSAQNGILLHDFKINFLGGLYSRFLLLLLLQREVFPVSEILLLLVS